MLSKRYGRSIGFTIIELLIGLALSTAVIAAAIKAIPVIAPGKETLAVDSSLDVSMMMQNVLKADLMFSGASGISVGETESFNFYVCKYSGSSISSCTYQDSALSADSSSMFCVATVTTGFFKGQSVAQVSLYRGGPDTKQLEYFFGTATLDDAGGLETLLQTACTTSFKGSIGKVSDGQWIRVNNPSTVKLRNFLVCGVDNSSFANLKTNSPPVKCLPVSNQTSTASNSKARNNSSFNCTVGKNGSNAVWIHYSLLNAKDEQAEPFYSTQIIPLWNRPCVNKVDQVSNNP